MAKSVLQKTRKGAKHKPVRPDLMVKGTYNRRIIRNSIRAWAERRGFKPSQTVHRKWLEWRSADLMKKFEKQVVADGIIAGGRTNG